MGKVLILTVFGLWIGTVFGFTHGIYRGYCRKSGVPFRWKGYLLSLIGEW